MSTKQEKFLQDLQKSLEGGAVQPDEFIEVVDVILEVIKDIKAEVDISVSKNSKSIDDGLKNLSRYCAEIAAELQDVKKNNGGKDIASLKATCELLRNELGRIEGKIPDVADLGPLERKIEISIAELEKKIPNLPDEVSGERIVAKINDLPIDDPDLLIDAEHIRGLDKAISKQIKNSGSGMVPMGGGIVGRDIIQDVDISSQLDGVTKTFNIPAVWRIITVDLSSFPYGSCRKTIDYTYTTSSITFTSQIDAATQLSSGQSCILTVVTG